MTEALAARAYRGVMAAAASAASLAIRLPGAEARWATLGARLGRLDAAARATARGRPAIWIHAASVGELAAVRPLLTRLRERFPGRLYVVSTLTATGLARARELPEAHLTLLFPLDAPAIVRPLLEQFRLEAFLFTETEIWPTFLAELEEARVPAIMVSGRVSAETAARARWLRPLYRRALAEVTCCMQTDADASRITALGADPRRVHVTGSLKFDAAPPVPVPELERVAAALAGHRIVVGGSTHAGEDEALLDGVLHCLPHHPDLVLLLAPRHPERVPAVAALVEARGLPLVRYTTLAAGAGAGVLGSPAVVLLDAVGPLAQCYGLGAVAFVGGTLVPAGGHNVLEPARAGRPVLVGPHTEHVAELVERLLAAGGAERLASAAALGPALEALLAAPGRADDMGARARSVVASGQGAVERHLKVISTRLAHSERRRERGISERSA